MADLTQILQGVASGLLTGGASAGTTFLTVFKNIKSRIADLEDKVGKSDADPKTGIYYTLDNLSKAIRSVKSEIESWRDEPPDWLVRIIQQKASRGTLSNEVWREFEERVDQQLRSFKATIQRLEDDLDRREEKLHDEIEKSSPQFDGLIMRAEYEKDSQKRADEIRKIQQNLASANSFLRGVMAALGYVDPLPPTTPPPPRPAPVPRPILPVKKK